jgi:hypothetical protein
MAGTVKESVVSDFAVEVWVAQTVNRRCRTRVVLLHHHVLDCVDLRRGEVDQEVWTSTEFKNGRIVRLSGLVLRAKQRRPAYFQGVCESISGLNVAFRAASI